MIIARGRKNMDEKDTDKCNEITGVYPGTFGPPHDGHVHIALIAAKMFKRLIIVCSANPDKEGYVLFTPEECKAMWLTYSLPPSVEVMTYAELKTSGIDFRAVVMVRGVRDDRDFEYEKRVMMDNNRVLGLDKFFLIVGAQEYKDISSSRARELAREGKLEELEKIVSASVAAALIEKLKNRKYKNIDNDPQGGMAQSND
jgi:pantetheine-phosphate adenylyltransferase